MRKYYLNKRLQLSGEYRIHIENCPFLANANERIYLGTFSFCLDALVAAKQYSELSNGCFFCLKECTDTKNMIMYESILKELQLANLTS